MKSDITQYYTKSPERAPLRGEQEIYTTYSIIEVKRITTVFSMKDKPGEITIKAAE